MNIPTFLARKPLARFALASVAIVLPSIASAQAPARPQLTAKEFLKDSIDTVGPKHAPVDQAIQAIANRAPERALTLLQSAKTADKKLPPPEVLLAKLFAMSGNAQGGRLWLEKAVVSYPADPEPYSLLGDVAFSEGRTTDAEVLFAKSLALAEKFTENEKRQKNFRRRGMAGLAAVHQRRENWKEAKLVLDRWLADDPENPLAHDVSGAILFYLDKPADAYKAFQEGDRLRAAGASKTDTPTPIAEMRMAELYQRKNDDAKTTEYVNLGAKNHPKDNKVRLMAGQIALRANLLDVALTHSDAAVKMDPTGLEAKLLRGSVARLRRDFQTAEHFFELAHLQSPGDFVSSNSLALLLSEQNDEAKQNRAFEFAVLNVQRFPLNGQSPARFDAMSTYGWVQFQRGQMEDAAKALQQVINANVLTPDSKYYVAQLLDYQQQNRDGAIKLLTEATESDAPFVNRRKAEELLATLKKQAGAATANTGTGTPRPNTNTPATPPKTPATPTTTPTTTPNNPATTGTNTPRPNTTNPATPPRTAPNTPRNPLPR